MFYLSADRTLMVVDITLDPWRVGQPRRLFRAPVRNMVLGPHNYAAAADGQRFLIDAAELVDKQETIAILIDWTRR